MKTEFLLLAQYGKTDVPLADIAGDYLGMTQKEANTRATRAALPFPAYRVGSNKSPWLVRVTDLAAYLDAEREKAARDWKERRN